MTEQTSCALLRIRFVEDLGKMLGNIIINSNYTNTDDVLMYLLPLKFATFRRVWVKEMGNKRCLNFLKFFEEIWYSVTLNDV